MFANSSGERSENNKKSTCAFYLFSSCKKGHQCRFLHNIPAELYNTSSMSPRREDLCYFFLKGKCYDGEKCSRFHGEPPSFNGTIKRVCIYFSQGRCERGRLCSYTHNLPDNFSPVNIIMNPQLSYNINEVPQVVINASDDVQSMTDVPKLCRFYRRGMCFFGDNCLNFHDKPEKDVESLLSDLRKDEELKERSEIISSERQQSSSNPPVMVARDNADPILRSFQRCPNASSRRGRITDMSSKANELPEVLNNNSTRVEELLNPSYDSAQVSKEPREVLCSNSVCKLSENPCCSLEAKEFDRNPKKFSRGACVTSSLKELSEKSRYPSESNEFAKTPHCSSDVKQYGSRDTSSSIFCAKSKLGGEMRNSSKPKKFVETQTKSKTRAHRTSNSNTTSSKSETFSLSPGDSSNNTCSSSKTASIIESKEDFKFQSNSTKEYASSTSIYSNESASTKPKEFARTTNSSSNVTFSSDISSKSEENFGEPNVTSKSQEFAKDKYASHSRESLDDRSNSSKSKVFYRSKNTNNYSKLGQFSNDSLDSNSRVSSTAPCSSTQRRRKFQNVDDNSVSTEPTRNSNIPKLDEQSGNANLESREYPDQYVPEKKQFRRTISFRQRTNESLNDNSKEFLKPSYISKLKRCSNLASGDYEATPKVRESPGHDDNSTKSTRHFKNENNSSRREYSIRQIRNESDFPPEAYATDKLSVPNSERTRFSATGDCNRENEARNNGYMTRKQRKSQRKPKGERTRVIYRSYPYFERP